LGNLKEIIILTSGFTVSGILAALGIFIGKILDFLNSFIQYDLPIWLIIIIFPIMVYSIMLLIKDLMERFKKPLYLKFTSMEYANRKNKTYKLEWEWIKRSKKYVPDNFKIICQKCGCELAEISAGNYNLLHCPLCRDGFFDRLDREEYSEVRNIIDIRIKTN
jgi:hypothetical protein